MPEMIMSGDDDEVDDAFLTMEEKKESEAVEDRTESIIATSAHGRGEGATLGEPWKEDRT